MAQSSKNYYHMGTIYVHNKIDMQNSRLSVGEPIDSNDATTKNYVDSRITVAGLNPGVGLYRIDNTFNVSNSLGNVTALGTINTGTWAASAIQVPYGGTGKINFSPNKLIIGNGSNPIVSVNELTFDTNLFTIDSTVKIINSTPSSGFTSGGSFTIYGGASILGKLWINNDLNIKGDVTLGNLVINGSTSFSNINAGSSVFTTMTSNNVLVNNSLTSGNLTTTNLRNTNSTIENIQSTNITTHNLHTTNLTSSNLTITTITNLNHLNVTNTTTFNLISAVTTSANQVSINITSSSLIANNSQITNSTITSLFSPSLRSTNFISTNITSNNLFINSNSILSTASINNLISTNSTIPNVLTSNITSSNINTSFLILGNSSTIPNLLSTNVISNNITTSNLSIIHSTHQNISSGNLNVSGISILSSITSNNLIVTHSTLSNNITTNETISNSIITSLTNTNLISNNITSTNLTITGIATLDTLNSSNLTTGELVVNNISNLNQVISNNASISNLHISNISILNTVVSSNLSSGSIQTTNLITNSITSNSTLLTNIRSTNITTSNIRSTSLNISGISTLSTIASFNLSTGTLSVSDSAFLNNLIVSNSTLTNIITNSSTCGNIFINSNINLQKQLQIGSNFTGGPITTSGNLVSILPCIYTNNISDTSDIIPLWSPFFISSSTLTAENPISTEKISSIYIQGNPITGINQTVTHSSALSIGYVSNETSGNLNGQIMLEREDGNWYGSIYTESGTNRLVICNASLAGGSGLGLYTYTNTPIVFSHIPSANTVTPSSFAQFTRTTSNFYSTENSTNTSSGSVVISGGLGVNKTLTCNSLALPNIFTSEPNENDTVTIPEGTSVVILKSSTNLNIINLVLPDNPINGQILHITSINDITTINLSNGYLGSTLPPTNLQKYYPLRFIYYFVDNAWFLI